MERPSRQAGYGMLLALVVLVLGSLYGLMQGLSEATAQNRREDHDQAVLRQARDALIARAALDANRPGSLPCPDLNDDGVAELLAGNACPAYIGRVPWRTLQLPELRDSAGERLWYVLSQPFTDSSTSVINSDTQGTLVMTGLAPATNVIALVLAPGAALDVAGVAQDRSPVGRNVAANYLEGENRDGANTVYVARTACATADCAGGPFNDKVLAITARDLFPVVENMVAKRLQTEVRDRIFKEGAAFADKGHFQRWRDHAGVNGQAYFPFAVPFVPPEGSSFRGALNTYDGLMPVTSEAAFVGWELANVNPALNPGLVEETPGSNVLNAATACSASSFDQIICSVRFNGGTAPRIRITGHAVNVAASFVDPVQIAGATSSALGDAVTSVFNTQVTSGALAGSARVEAVVNLGSRIDSDTVPSTIVIGKPPYNLAIVGASGASAWFIANNWQRVVLYSVAPAATTALPKDVSTGGTDCAQVNAECRDALSTVNGGTNRHLVLLLAGLAVDNNLPRAGATLDRYLEGRNVWTNVAAHNPLHQFETFRAGRDRTNVVPGNDKLAVIAP
jgi:hypothetical protein